MVDKRYTYCPHCGGELEETIIDQRKRERCSRCERIFYVNPLPVVSCLLVNKEQQLLLVLRKNDPHKGLWCLPMGFAEVDENIQGAALRELEEEAGIKGRVIRLLDAESENESSYGNIVVLCYEVEHLSGEIMAGDDAEDARFFPLDDLPELAFKTNRRAIKKYRQTYSL